MFGFTISHLEASGTTQFYAFILYRPCIFPSSSLLTSLLSYHFEKQSKNKQKKWQEQVTKKFTEWKQAHVGMELSKPAKQAGTTHSHYPYLLCHFANDTQQKILYMDLAYSNSNEHSNHHCSLHSFSHIRQSISATFSNNKISQHNLKLRTYHTDPALLTACAYKTDYICHAQ